MAGGNPSFSHAFTPEWGPIGGQADQGRGAAPAPQVLVLHRLNAADMQLCP